MIQYRKTRDGKWAVFGPCDEIEVGNVTVSKKDGGTKREKVVRLSKPFDVDGVPHRFGYIEEQAARADERPAAGSGGGSARRGPAATKRCWECGCAFTYADAKANGGDWGESYCGC